MRISRGDVVRVDWPFSDRTGSKVRPAVVVQADVLNGRIADTILVLVSRTQRAVGMTEVLIDPADEVRVLGTPEDLDDFKKHYVA